MWYKGGQTNERSISTGKGVSMSELKPCAFCGSKPDTAESAEGHNYVHCSSVTCILYTLKYVSVDRWNTRLSPKTDTPQPDSICQEEDGCPTEGAVLKKFWREHQSPAPVEDVGRLKTVNGELEDELHELDEKVQTLLDIIGNYEKVRKQMNKIAELHSGE